MENYQLPEILDPNDSPVTITILTTLPKWLVYNKDSKTFSIAAGATKAGDKCNLVIKIKLTDLAGGSDIVSFTISIEDPPIVEDNGDGDLMKQNAPKPTISSITARGMVTITWNKNIKIPRNLTLAKLTNTTWYNESTYLDEIKVGLEIKAIPSWQSKIDDLKFTW